MARLKKKSKKSKQSNPVGIIGAGALLFALVIGAVSYMFTAQKVDALTNCVVDAITLDTVFLIDTTGGFSENQIRTIQKVIDTVLDETPTGERISLFYVDTKQYKGLSDPVIDLCKPKSARDANPLFENVRAIQEKFEEDFLKEIKDEVEIVDVENAKISPLIESLHDLSTEYSLNKDRTFKKLVIFSDLLQHTPRVSFYKSTLPVLIGEKSDLSLVADLQGLSMDAYVLLREGSESKYQNGQLYEWWSQYSLSANTKSFDVTKVR